MKYFLVPLMTCFSGLFMSAAWIGHLKYKHWSFGTALLLSWLIVLPEYCLNVTSARWGQPEFTGGQVAAMHLAAGVICVALISKFFLGEPMSARQMAGFVLMGCSVMLIVFK